MKLRPGFFSTDLGSWEDNGMKDDVILSDELVQLDVFGIAPPLFPLVSVACRDGDIANAGVKPRINDLLLVTRQRDFGSPSHVPRDTAWFQAFLQPSRGDGLAVIRPLANCIGFLEEGFDSWLQLVQLDENVVRLFGDGRGTVDFASRVLELESV